MRSRQALDERRFGVDAHRDLGWHLEVAVAEEKVLAEDVDVAPEPLQATRFVDRARTTEAEQVVDDLDARLDGGRGPRAQLGAFAQRKLRERLARGHAGVDASIQRFRGI